MKVLSMLGPVFTRLGPFLSCRTLGAPGRHFGNEGPYLALFGPERSPSFDIEFDLEGMIQCQNGPDFWN